jgi:membrane protein insertase Oxa1/YidC/SpoIIIJ
MKNCKLVLFNVQKVIIKVIISVYHVIKHAYLVKIKAIIHVWAVQIQVTTPIYTYPVSLKIYRNLMLNVNLNVVIICYIIYWKNVMTAICLIMTGIFYFSLNILQFRCSSQCIIDHPLIYLTHAIDK